MKDDSSPNGYDEDIIGYEAFKDDIPEVVITKWGLDTIGFDFHIFISKEEYENNDNYMVTDEDLIEYMAWKIVEKDFEGEPDCYAIQEWVDGFGYDTNTVMICKDLEQVKKFYFEELEKYSDNIEKLSAYGLLDKEKFVVPIKFGEYYRNYLEE
jgi:hypothetical protein